MGCFLKTFLKHKISSVLVLSQRRKEVLICSKCKREIRKSCEADSDLSYPCLPRDKWGANSPEKYGKGKGVISYSDKGEYVPDNSLEGLVVWFKRTVVLLLFNGIV